VCNVEGCDSYPKGYTIADKLVWLCNPCCKDWDDSQYADEVVRLKREYKFEYNAFAAWVANRERGTLVLSDMVTAFQAFEVKAKECADNQLAQYHEWLNARAAVLKEELPEEGDLD
jgi:hypothetical protein